MDTDQERLKSFTRRALVMGGLKAVFLTALAARLGWLQLFQAGKYETLAENNRITVRLIPPVRGTIHDRMGRMMAENEQNFMVQLVPEQTEDLEQSLQRLSQIMPLRPTEMQSVLKQARQQPSFVPIEVIDHLSWEQVAAIEVNLPDLPGISIDVGQRRFYPEGPMTAHVVGYVASVNKDEVGDDPVLKLPGFRIGKTGLEKKYDLALRGTPGTSRVEVNVSGRTVRDLEKIEGTPGARLDLTLDLELQKKVQAILLPEKSASAVVMDVVTGAVYAMNSNPSFDPNLFTTGISQANWQAFMADEARPLSNKCVSGQYPPGSTFKMVTALAGLEAGVITANTSVYCPGHYDLGKHRFHCWKRGGHGTVDLTQALAQSCDTFFYHASREIGIDRIAVMASRMGYAQSLGIELEEERTGIMPSQSWKMGALGKRWEPGETIVASIGQGYTLATPLQLAVMTARIVNGGRAVKPWMIAAMDGKKTQPASQQWASLNINPLFLDMVKRGMDACVLEPTGTAHGSAIKDLSMSMGGKTGTAQVKRITMQERNEGLTKQEDQPWRFRHHALFVGYAPTYAPRYACAVVVEHGGSGSAAAAPMGRDILTAVQKINPAGITFQTPPEPVTEPAAKEP